jgi:EpsI family protein
MVAVLMADLFRRRGPHALALVAAAPPVALFLNGWRAVALILNPHSEVVAIHNLQGIAILLAGVVALFLLDGALTRVGLNRPWRRSAPTGSPAPAAALVASGPGLAPVGLLAALALATWALPRVEIAPPEALRLSEQLRTGIGDLFSRELEIDRTFLGSAGFRDSVVRRFTRDGHAVDAFVGVGWRAGRARSPLSPKTAFPGSGWIIEQEGTRVLEPDGRRVRSILFRSATHWLLVYHWYEGAGGLAAEALRSLTAIDASPLRRSGEIVVVRLMTDVEPPTAAGMPAAEARLADFYTEIRGTLDRTHADLDGGRGKGFPDFSGWEKTFHDTAALDVNRILSSQVLGSKVGLGMSLAN